jgi:hypothetical protein
MRIKNLRQKAKGVSIYNFDTFFVPDTKKRYPAEDFKNSQKIVCYKKLKCVFSYFYTHFDVGT